MRCPNFASGRISSRDYGWIPLGWSGSGSLTWDHLDQGRSVDLLQVDLLASEAKPCLATKQPTASNEVARARLVSLDGFPFTFHAKNGDWRDSHLGFQVSFASPWLQWQNVLIPLRLNLLNVCVYLHHRRSKFVFFVRKLTSSRGWKKTKPCLNLESILGKEISQPRNPWHPHTFLNLQRLFNTRISLPVTLTESEKVS